MEIFFILAFVPLLFSFRMFDKLVKKLYEEHRRQWETDGRPIGLMWRPKEVSMFSSASDWAGKKLQSRWVFKTPEWTKRDPVALQWLWQFRLSVAACGFCFGAWTIWKFAGR